MRLPVVDRRRGRQDSRRAWSATKDETHDIGAFQLIVISFVDHDPMSST